MKMFKNTHILKVTAGGTKQTLLCSTHCALKPEDDIEKECIKQYKLRFVFLYSCFRRHSCSNANKVLQRPG